MRSQHTPILRSPTKRIYREPLQKQPARSTALERRIKRRVLQSTAGLDEHASAIDAAVGQNARPPNRSKGRRRAVARAQDPAQINSDPSLSAYTDAIVKRGRDIAVHTVAKRLASCGIRLSRRERLVFAESFAGTRPNPTGGSISNNEERSSLTHRSHAHSIAIGITRPIAW